jgi:hypothetical protein
MRKDVDKPGPDKSADWTFASRGKPMPAGLIDRTRQEAGRLHSARRLSSRGPGLLTSRIVEGQHPDSPASRGSWSGARLTSETRQPRLRSELLVADRTYGNDRIREWLQAGE